MATTLIKALMFLLSINLLLYVGGIRVIGNDNTDFVNQFINTSSLEDSGTVNVPADLQDTLPRTLEESGSGLLDFIDALGAVKKFIYFIVNIIFTPLGLFTAAGMPQAIVLLVGMPLMFAAILGGAYFLRSGG